MAYDTEELISTTVTALEEHGKDGVLKLGELTTHVGAALGKQPSSQTLKNHIKKHLDGPDDDLVAIHINGYYSLPDVDFEDWRSKNTTTSRQAIPQEVKMRLWAASAGHCQFRGCYKPLAQSAITTLAGNFSQIAHIVAASPDGPRGRPDSSEELSTQFSNLMLLCYDCHHLIDTKEETYTVTMLEQMKQERESFIHRVIQAHEDLETNILILSAPIQHQRTHILREHVVTAVAPHIPREIVQLDLNDDLQENDPSYWDTGRRQLNRRLARQIELLDGHLSVFALAPIPLCVYLGRLLGNKRVVQLYQNNRNVEENRWHWEPTVECREGEIDFTLEDEATDTNHIAIAFSISQEIDEEALDRWRQTQDAHLYRMLTDEKSSTWLRHRGQMDLFRAKYNELLTLLEHQHGKEYHLHILGPVSAPIAVEIGRQLPPKVAPTLHLYDRIDGEFQHAFSIAHDERLG